MVIVLSVKGECSAELVFPKTSGLYHFNDYNFLSEIRQDEVEHMETRTFDYFICIFRVRDLSLQSSP